MTIKMKPGGPSFKQGFYLKHLSEKTGIPLTYDEIEAMTQREARDKITELKKIADNEEL